MRATSLATVFALFVVTAPAAAAPRWTRATPFGGDLAAVAVAPSAPQVAYAMAFGRPFFASRDGGATWERRGGLFLDPFNDVDLMVSPWDPETVYAFVHSIGLWRSRDGARTWQTAGPWTNDLLGLTADRDEPGLLYAAALSGLYRSRDGGETWELAAFQDRLVDRVAADPRQPGTYFAVVQDTPDSTAAVWKSSDRGVSWRQIATLDAQFLAGVPPFVFDPARPDTLYLAGGHTYGAALRSDDGGVTWNELPGTYGVLSDLTVMNDGTLVALCGQLGVSRSTDRGETWEPPFTGSAAREPRDYLHQVAALGDPAGGLLAAGGEGVWISTDSGVSWHESNQGLFVSFVSSILVPPADPPVVLAILGQEVFRSTDLGGTWQRIHASFDEASPRVLTAVDPRRPQTLYGIGGFGDVDQPVASTDGGATWRSLPFPYADQCSGSLCYVTMLAFSPDPGDPDTLYAAGWYWLHFGPPPGPFLLRTTNGGATWESLPAFPAMWSFLVLPDRPSPLIATNRKRLFTQGKSGGGWRRAGRGLPELGGVAALATDPRHPRRLYAGTPQGVFGSDDAGETFQPLTRSLAPATIGSLLVDPLDSTRLYATTDKGYFRWNPGRRAWTPFNEGLPIPFRGGPLALDPRHPSRLYAGTVEGIFRIDLDGD